MLLTGLGHLLRYGRELNAMEQVIGIVIVLIGLLAGRLLVSPWERFLLRRRGTNVKGRERKTWPIKPPPPSSL